MKKILIISLFLGILVLAVCMKFKVFGETMGETITGAAIIELTEEQQMEKAILGNEMQIAYMECQKFCENKDRASFESHRFPDIVKDKG